METKSTLRKMSSIITGKNVGELNGNSEYLKSIPEVIAFLVAKFHDRKISASILVERWVRSFKEAEQSPAYNALVARQNLAIEAAAKLPLPQRLILDSLRDFWVPKRSAKAENDLAVSNQFMIDQNNTPNCIYLLRQRVFNYNLERLDTALRQANLPAGLRDAIFENTRAEVRSFVQRIGGDADDANNDRILGSTLNVDVPHTLTFQVGGISSGLDAKELQQRFAGFGVLVRNSSKAAAGGEWHCLTLGQLLPRSGGPPWGHVADTASPAFQSVADLAVFGHNPWRVISQAGLHGWVVPFYGAPLTARPKLHDAFETFDNINLTHDHPANVGSRLYMWFKLLRR
jgi:hypothetical protein